MMGRQAIPGPRDTLNLPPASARTLSGLWLSRPCQKQPLLALPGSLPGTTLHMEARGWTVGALPDWGSPGGPHAQPPGLLWWATTRGPHLSRTQPVSPVKTHFLETLVAGTSCPFGPGGSFDSACWPGIPHTLTCSPSKRRPKSSLGHRPRGTHPCPQGCFLLREHTHPESVKV